MDERLLCGCGCGLVVKGDARGRCGKYRPGHYSRTAAFRQVMATVDPRLTVHTGASNGQWRGGRRIDTQGYIVVRIGGKDVREHRIVAAEKLGRSLRRGEVVHHVNGNRADNRPENIEVLPSQSAHMKQHITPEEARRRGMMTKRSRAALAALESETQ